MKKNILNIYIPIILLSAFLINCSGSNTAIDEKQQEVKPILSKDESKKKALEFFVNGGVYETQGNYEAAISHYEKGLSYDTSAALY